jgi:hypothetical protein
LEDSVIAAAVG